MRHRSPAPEQQIYREGDGVFSLLMWGRMVLACYASEHRLLGGILSEPGVLALCGNVDAHDFHDMNLSSVYRALRNVEARIGVDADGLVPVDEIVALLQRESPGVDLSCIADACELPSYGGQELLVREEVRWVRKLSKRRQNLKEFA